MTGSRLVATSLSHPLTDPCQFDMIAQDKKVKGGKLTFIPARAIGGPSSKATSIPSKCALSSKTCRNERGAILALLPIMIAASVSFPGVGATEVAGRR
jgi:hypothetical protein